jgi:4-hydroxy-3-methylbut-2-en-1-yl diphosphate synthase IspG/GcpE
LTLGIGFVRLQNSKIRRAEWQIEDAPTCSDVTDVDFNESTTRTTMKTVCSSLLLSVGLLLLVVVGTGLAQDAPAGKAVPQGKHIMFVFTTDDNGELNPCG